MYITLIFFLLGSTFAATFGRALQDDTGISKKYIVKFKFDVVSSGNLQLKNALALKADYEFLMDGFHGFSGSMSAEEVEYLQSSELIEYVEEEAEVRKSALVQQKNASWNLARISNRQPGSVTYTYDDSAGEGTCAYVIDTGISTSHPEFGGRATFLVDFSGEGKLVDGDGHGTHVAGTIGSKTYGVAKKTKLFAIKVLDSHGSGTNAGVIKGFEYAVKDAKNRTAACSKGFVASVSLGGYFKQSVNDAAAVMVKAGIFVAVAAGNEHDDAARYSPSSEPSVCTVGASAVNETLPSWTNTGKIVDIIAPGVNITSTFLNNGLETYSGTSMATPHVAGLGAYLLSLGSAKVGKVCEAIQDLATKDALGNVPSNTRNLLAYNGVTA